MIRPRVLVLLAAHNGGKWIVQQIETILNQQSVDVRLVVSDDGSTDDTLAKVRQFAADPRVSVVTPLVPTGSAAQNFIWLICSTRADKFDFVALSDQDDIWHEGKLAVACSALKARGAAGYSCAVTAFWERGRERALTQKASPRDLDFMFEGAGQGCTFVLQNAFFQRVQEFFRSNSQHLQSLHYHDWAIYALSRSWKLTWHFDADSMVRYRQHERNDTGARLSRSGIAKRLRLIKSGWYHRQLKVISSICATAAPADARIAEWNELLAQAPSLPRRLKIARICIMQGRRRKFDNVVLLVAVVSGWV
jgi:rhamnosyltransferase